MLRPHTCTKVFGTVRIAGWVHVSLLQALRAACRRSRFVLRQAVRARHAAARGSRSQRQRGSTARVDLPHQTGGCVRKCGIRKAPFALPEFIAASGITRIS